MEGDDKARGAVRGQQLTADGRPWGVLTSIVLVVAIVKGSEYAYALLVRYFPRFVAGDDVVALVELSRTFFGLFAVVLAVKLSQISAPTQRLSVCEYLGWKWPRLRYFVIGIAVVLAELIVFWFVAPSFLGSLQILGGLTDGLIGLLRTCIVAPFYEETLIRGFLWRGIQYRFGNLAALVVTTVVFALLHANVLNALTGSGDFFGHGAVGQATGGLLYGLARWASGGIAVPFVMHAIHNSFITLGLPALIRFLDWLGNWLED